MTILSETLSELEKTQKDFWNVSKETGNFLGILVRISRAKNVLEIGTSNGYSGLCLLNALKDTKGHLTTIEYYDKRQSIARENFDKCGFSGMYTPILGYACEILESFEADKKFDFVFIDANKREYIKYFELIKPHLAQNAVIAADNVISHKEKVQPFLDEIMSDKTFATEILNFPAGLSVSCKLDEQ